MWHARNESDKEQDYRRGESGEEQDCGGGWIAESSLRFLFVAQSDHGVYGDGAARGNIARGEGDEEQDRGGGCEGDWVVGAYAEEQSGQQAHQA